MPLGEFFSCVWLVLLALTLMTTFPRHFYCSCSFTTSSSSSPSSSSSSSSSTSSSTSSSSSSSSSSTIVKSSQPEPHSATATAAATSSSLCHNSIDTFELISTSCEQPLRHQQQPRMRITGEINEGPGPPPYSCPPSCSSEMTQAAAAAASEKNPSCYRYLGQEDCEEPWLNDWSEVRLRHCCEHSVHEAVPDAQNVLNDREQCKRHVNELLEVDLFVAKVTCQFSHVLLRYDCTQKYSVNDCETCRETYRRWVCASLIPHWRQRHKIKPCRSICHSVEQTCPFFLPADKNPGYSAQYAGEPIFQCIDAHIPETGEQLLKSTYGSGCCYEYCEQRRNVNVSTATSSYHRVDKSKFPHTRIVSCMQGCNDSENDPSHESMKSAASSPCHNARSTTVTSETSHNKGETKRDRAAVPFVNFVSSCPSSDPSSHAEATAAATHSGTRANSFSRSSMTPYWFLCSSVLAALVSVNSAAGLCLNDLVGSR